MMRKFHPSQMRRYRRDGYIIHVSERGIYSLQEDAVCITPHEGPPHKVSTKLPDGHVASNVGGMQDTKMPIVSFWNKLYHIGERRLVPLQFPEISAVRGIDYSLIRGHIVYNHGEVFQLGEIDGNSGASTHANKICDIPHTIHNVLLSQTSPNVYVTWRDTDSLSFTELAFEDQWGTTQINVIDSKNRVHAANFAELANVQSTCLLQPDSSDIITCVTSDGISQLDLWHSSCQLVHRRVSSSPIHQLCSHFDRNVVVLVDKTVIWIADLRSNSLHKIVHGTTCNWTTGMWCIRAPASIFLTNHDIVSQYF